MTKAGMPAVLAERAPQTNADAGESRTLANVMAIRAERKAAYQQVLPGLASLIALRRIEPFPHHRTRMGERRSHASLRH